MSRRGSMAFRLRLIPISQERRLKGTCIRRLFAYLAAFRSRNTPLIYSVWRLDAATPALAQGLVDKAMAAEAAGLTGQVFIDETTSGTPLDYGYGGPEWDLRMAANFARAAGFSVTEDQNSAEFGTPPAPLRCDNAAFYSGWYSYDNYNNAFTWNTGAIGYHLDSASAIDPRGGADWSANALINGITVTHGSVAEPYTTGFAHSDGVFRNLSEGANVGDAFLRNTTYLKWMMLNIGDPLYTPFPAGLPAMTATKQFFPTHPPISDRRRSVDRDNHAPRGAFFEHDVRADK